MLYGIRRLSADEQLAIETLKELLTSLRADVLERLASSHEPDHDTFLKGKAQAYADILAVPAMQAALEEAERAAAIQETYHVGRRPEEPSGYVQQWLRRRRRDGAA